MKHQNGEPFRFQKEHQMQRQPLPVLRVHPDDEAAEDQDNLYEAFLKYHRQISEYAPLRDHRSLGGCHILTAGKYLHALWMDRLQRFAEYALAHTATVDIRVIKEYAPCSSAA